MPNVRDTCKLRLTQEDATRLARRRKPPVRRNSAVEVLKVDLRVWRTALELAGGDATRLIVESATSVLVTNRSRRKVIR